jgi:hypothetical protein
MSSASRKEGGSNKVVDSITWNNWQPERKVSPQTMSKVSL